MKIAIDAKRMLNNATGLGNHARILANAMMRDYPDSDYLFFAPKVQDRYLAELHGAYELRLPATRISQTLHPWWRSYGITEDLLRARVDIYHGISNEIPLNIHSARIPSVVTIHDLIFLKHEEQYPWIDRQIYTYKTKYAVQHAQKIIAVSEETKRDLMEYYKVPERKIAVIYQSIDSRFSLRETEDHKRSFKAKYNLPEQYILNVGSFFPRKNQLKLIDAFDLIKDKTKSHLVLAGAAGGMKEKIKKVIADKGLTDRIHLIDSISNDDMPLLYQRAGLFVFPSAFEGFGMPVLEALVSGVPVIATRGGAIEEAAGSGSLLIDPSDINGIAASMLTVVNDSALRDQMITAGYSHAQAMTDKTFAEQTMNVYREVARRD